MRLRNLLRVAPSTIHGRGVFARRDIAAGCYLGSYEGRTVRHDGKYVLWVESGDGRQAARLGEPPLRFLNHRARPNARFDGFDLYALHAIAAGEEVTIDYGGDPA